MNRENPGESAEQKNADQNTENSAHTQNRWRRFLYWFRWRGCTKGKTFLEKTSFYFSLLWFECSDKQFFDEQYSDLKFIEKFEYSSFRSMKAGTLIKQIYDKNGEIIEMKYHRRSD